LHSSPNSSARRSALVGCGNLSAQRGFTLAELMVVVVIAGALAVTAVAAMRSHIDSSRSVEALTMVQSIRGAQERYRSEQGVYLDVSQEGGFYPQDPAQPGVGENKRSFFYSPSDDSHPDNARWTELLPTAPGPVRFGYMTNAGAPGVAMTTPAYDVSNHAWPTTTEPWFVIQAVGDVDDDDAVSYYLASSINGEVFRHNDGE
jgi:prepilin-type N-terminal cleavage/methylation domain-containing protein